jgi:hypothetical protein
LFPINWPLSLNQFPPQKNIPQISSFKKITQKFSTIHTPSNFLSLFNNPLQIFIKKSLSKKPGKHLTSPKKTVKKTAQNKNSNCVTDHQKKKSHCETCSFLHERWKSLKKIIKLNKRVSVNKTRLHATIFFWKLEKKLEIIIIFLFKKYVFICIYLHMGERLESAVQFLVFGKWPLSPQKSFKNNPKISPKKSCVNFDPLH